ncbi:unnamed protein product [Arctogadus glacialis]
MPPHPSNPTLRHVALSHPYPSNDSIIAQELLGKWEQLRVSRRAEEWGTDPRSASMTEPSALSQAGLSDETQAREKQGERYPSYPGDTNNSVENKPLSYHGVPLRMAVVGSSELRLCE